MLLVSYAFAQEWHALRAARASASSSLQSNWNRYEENYHPSYALDGNPATAWVEGVEGTGEGQLISWVTSTLSSARTVKLRVRNGYQKSQVLFDANGAIKDLAVRITDGAEARFTLTRTMGWQELTIDNGGKPMKGITLEILSTYPGKSYQDTCLSDVEVLVDSTVPYNAAAEDAKKAELDAWIKGRVEEAKYYANLPVDYPFAGTKLTRTETPIDGATWAAAVREERWGPLRLRHEGAWMSLAAQRRIPMPDGVWYWESIGHLGGTAAPISLGNLLRTADFALFAATGPTAVRRGGKDDPRTSNDEQTTWSNVHIEGDPGAPGAIWWTALRTVEERGTYTEEREYFLSYADGRASEMWIGEPKDAGVGTLLTFHWTEAGKIDRVDGVEAVRQSDGDEEFEEDAIPFLRYRRVTWTVE